MFDCCLVGACSSLKESEGGVDKGMVELGGMERRKTVVKIYCMREYLFTIKRNEDIIF